MIKTKGMTDEDITQLLIDYENKADDMEELTQEGKSWKTAGFTNGVSIALLLEIRGLL